MEHTPAPMSTLEKTRIDSWKAIATFLGRDLRTVQRWEKERALPVYRIPGERGRIFAYTEELSSWLEQGQRGLEEETASSDTGFSQPGATDAGEHFLPPTEQRVNAVTSRGRAPWSWVMLAAAVVALGAAAWFATRLHRREAEAASAPATPFGKGSANAAAESAFLQGRFFWNQRKPDSLARALQFFRQAEQLDPNFAAAYAGEAETYALMPEYAAMPDAQAFAAAKTAAQRAVRLDPNSASAHRVLAFALFYGDWNVNGALQEFDRAVALDPRSAQTYHWYANALMTMHRYDQASAEMQKARELDPSSISMLTDQVLLDHYHGAKLEDSLQQLRELSQAQPNFILPQQYAAGMLLENGEVNAWAAQAGKLAEATGTPEDGRVAQLARSLEGKTHTAGEFLRGLCDARTDPLVIKGLTPAHMALVCLRADEPAASAQMWRVSYQAHDPNFISFAVSPLPPALAGEADLRRMRADVQVPGDGKA